jgi:hypothetical protein
VKILFFIITLIAINSNVYCQEKDCSQFQKGYFRYQDSVGHNIIVKRTANRQEEIDEATGEHVKMKIRWTGACEYELKQTWTSIKANRRSNRGPTKVTITAVLDDGSYRYSLHCACDTTGAVTNEGIMIKVKEKI